MPSQKLHAARQLIENKEYAAARAVLITITEPVEEVVIAARWIAKLDKGRIAARDKKQAAIMRDRIGCALIVCILVIGMIVFAISYYTQYQDAKAKIDRDIGDILTGTAIVR